MNETGLLFDRSELQDAIETGELIAWKKKRYIEFRETMQSTRYPCYFAVNAERTNSARYLFVGVPNDRDALLKLREGLRQYLEQYQSITERTTLVVFFKPPPKEQSEQEYRDQFWRVLEFLHKRDPDPWPSRIPRDPNDPEWEFCFSGEPMFIVGRAPFYTERQSRYTPYGLEITIQPRRVLDDISGNTMKGQRARSVIGDRLKDYDEIAPHPDIGDYGDSETREWKQYLLPASNEESLTEFPFEIQS
ncbi:YqcI/YcgG family protein [Halalkalicoccus paucihalophilus]|uniref:YqcI/YcgG family protein n=1 Tax=Halalkalicoccus paucihalophilus TaxID=1008153 RepID=A0A151A9W8_9EURY|nr:YqcI/YcgG family protein [Halalkalicoccus paucihalophilus]KYH24403.1 YqcI/YcgG family protein [Halalkalicoccus paucihalophilus]